MAPTLTASYFVNTGLVANLTSLVTPSFTPAVGEVIVVKAVAGWVDCIIGTPTGGGLTYTQRIAYTTPDLYFKLFTTVTVSATSMTVTVPVTGSGEPHAMIVERWSGAQLAGSPVTISATGSGAAATPSATLTTTAANSIVSWFNADLNLVDGAGRVYLTTSGTPVEEAYFVESTFASYVLYSAYQPAVSATSQTFGLSAPASQTWRLFAIEVQAASGGSGTPSYQEVGAGTDSLSVQKTGGSAGRQVPGYYTNWDTLPRLINISQNFQSIILFSAAPVGGINGSGALTWAGVDNTSGAQTNLVADIATCRARGQKIILAVGGWGNEMAFTSRGKSTTCINSIQTIATSLGGIDGIQWDTFEQNIPENAEYVWMGQQLKTGGYFGPSFSISIAVYPDTNNFPEDLSLAQAVVSGGACDWVMPMYYEGSTTQRLVSIASYITGNAPTWGNAIGYDHYLPIFGLDSSMVDYSTPAEIATCWNSLLAAHPTIAGGALWDIYNDINQYGNGFATTDAPLMAGGGSTAVSLAQTGSASDALTVVGQNLVSINQTGAASDTLSVVGSQTFSQTGNAADTLSVVGSPTSTTLTNFCEGTDGVAVSASNSGGPDQFSSVVLSGAGNTLNYSSTVARRGATALLATVGATAGTAYVTWSFSAVAIAYSRTYIYFTAAASDARIIAFYDATGTSLRCAVYVASNGFIYTVNAAGATIATSAAQISLNSWIRVELDCTGNASTGVITCRIYQTADSVTPTETLTNSSQNTGGTIGQVWIGSSASTTTSVTHYLDDVGVSTGGPLGPAPALAGIGTASDTLSVNTPTKSFAEIGVASDILNVSMSTTLGGGGYIGGYLTGYVQAGVIALDGAATTANTGASQVATQLGIVMPACVSGSVVIIGGSLRVNGATSGAAICTPPGTVVERAHLQRDATPPAELFVWTWVSDGTTPTHTFAFTGPAGSTGYAISLAAQGYAGVEVATPIDSLTLLAEVASASPHTTPAVIAPASTGWALALFADRNSSSWTPTVPLVERADTAGGVNCASVELCDSAGTVTAGSHSYVSTGTAATTAAVMALGYLHQFTGTVVAISQSDNGQCGEFISVTATAPISEQGTAADALTVTLGLSDAGIGVTTCAVSVAVSLSDIASVSDTFSVTVPNLLSDTASVFDTVNATASNLLGHVAIAFDALIVTASSSAGDVGAAVTTVTVNAAISLTDISTGTDGFVAGVSALVSDVSSGADSLSVAVLGTFSDAGAGVTTCAVGVAILCSDASVVAEICTISASASATDSSAAADSFNVAVQGTPVLVETGSASDTLNMAGPKSIGDVAVSSDASNVVAANSLGESASSADTSNVVAANSLGESASSADTSNVVAANSPSDNASSADTFNIVSLNLLGDSASLSDTLNIVSLNLLGDNASLSDTLAFDVVTVLSDNAAAFDTLNVAVPKSFSDSGSAFDTLQITAPRLLGDSAASADLLTVTVTALLSATASSSDTMQVAGVIRMLPQGIGVTVVLSSGLSGTRTVASGITSTVVQAGNGQSGAAPQGNRGNSSAVVQ